MIRPVDLGICHGYEYDGDPARTAIVLPGRMLAGMPVNAFAQQGLTDAAEHAWPGIWLTPLLEDAESVVALRRRTAPALLIGGTADPMWNGRIAREITDDVLELEGADHGLAKAEHLQRISDTVEAFAVALTV